MTKAASILLLLAACSSEPYTWGDASRGLSELYCDARERCGFPAAGCVEHTVMHLCELDDSCGREVDESVALGRLEGCESALVEPSCALVGFYGIVPQECRDVMALHPRE